MTEINTNTGVILESLNNKLDIDLKNLTEERLQLLINALNIKSAKPDYNNGVQVSQNYTVENNGFLKILGFKNATKNFTFKINEQVFNYSSGVEIGSEFMTVLVPVSKGDIFKITSKYTDEYIGDGTEVYFYPDK